MNGILEKNSMEKQRPEVTIESAEPLTDTSSQSESEENEVLTKKRPTRLNALSSGISKGYVPRGMRPANFSSGEQESDDEEGEYEDAPAPKPAALINSGLLLVAASLGIGILIAYYGVGLLKPAVDKVVEAAEELVEEE